MMVTAKSDKLGGQRTKGRHVGELGMGGALALLLVSFIPSGPDGWMNAWQLNLSSVVLTGAFSTLAKFLHERGVLPDVGKISLLLLLVGSTGCAVQLGNVAPTIHTGADGETIVACEVTGITLAFGDGGICRNVEGGHVSQASSNLFSSTIGLAMQAVAGVFGGIGGIGSAMLAQPVAAPVAPAAHPPAIVIEPSDVEKPDLGDWFTEDP